MATPIALCIEDLAASSSEGRYLRCVALVGRRPGLRLDSAARAVWQDDAAVACELWVSADDRLIVYRPTGAPDVELGRTGRTLLLPCDKPVVAIDQDVLTIGGRRLLLHVHGPTEQVAAPSRLAERGRPSAAALAAAVAMGAAVAGCQQPVEVRESPPAVAVPEPTSSGTGPTATVAVPPANPPTAVPSTTQTTTTSEPIEVRDRPPEAPAEPRR